jgi:hypothetical protein
MVDCRLAISRGAAGVIVTSPRLRGEVGLPTGRREAPPDDKLRNPGEGDSPRVELVDRTPHPNPLPAKSGEREKV